MNSCEPPRSIAAVEPRSPSSALSCAQFAGAKYWRSVSVGDSSITASPWSKGCPAWALPLPVTTKMSPAPSIVTPAGAQMAPSLAVGTS